MVHDIWRFPKIGDPNFVPYIVGSSFSGPQTKVPPNFRKLPKLEVVDGFRLWDVEPRGAELWVSGFRVSGLGF